MTSEFVRRRARAIIACDLSVAMNRVRDDAEFVRDLGADSLDMVTLPRALEESFGVRFSDDEVAFCKTVGTTIDLIETKLENRGLTACR